MNKLPDRQQRRTALFQLHYFTKWVWGRAGACIELRTLYSKLSSHDLKFCFFLFRCFMFLFVYVCVSVCAVCLFVLLCINIILSEQVNDFAFSSALKSQDIYQFGSEFFFLLQRFLFKNYTISAIDENLLTNKFLSIFPPSSPRS